MNTQELKKYCNVIAGRVTAGLHENGLIDYENYPYHQIGLYNSSRILSYSFNTLTSANWKKFNSLQHDIGQWCGLNSDNSGVRLSYQERRYTIEIPKPSRFHKPVTMDRINTRCGSFMAPVGLDIRDKPVVVGIQDDIGGHFLFSGTTRSGKTNALYVYLWGLMQSATPDDMRFIIIDVAKRRLKWSVMERSDYLACPLITEMDQAISSLAWASRETEIRSCKPINEKFQKIIIVIDEVKTLIGEDGSPQATNYIEHISSVGAELGIHLVLATQFPTVASLGNKRNLKGNLSTRLCGKVDDKISAQNATGLNNTMAEQLQRPGDFLKVEDGEVIRVSTAIMDNRLFDKLSRGHTPPIVDLQGQLNEFRQTFPGQVDMVGPKTDFTDVADISLIKSIQNVDPVILYLAVNARKKGKPLSAGSLRNLTKKLKLGQNGSGIGQNLANEYRKLAEIYRDTFYKFNQ